MSTLARTFLAATLASGAIAARDPSGEDMDLFFRGPGSAPGVWHLEARDPGVFFERLAESHQRSGERVYEPAELAAPLAGALEEPELAEVRALAGEGRYAEAYRPLAARLVRRAAPAPWVELGRRLEALQDFFPRLDAEAGQWARVLRLGAADLLAGRDAHALLRVSYALSLNPVEPGLEGLLKRLEALTGRRGRRIPAGTGLSLLETLLIESREAFSAGRPEKVARLCRDALALKPGDPAALARLGSALFLQGRYAAAAAVWGQALGQTSGAEAGPLKRMRALALRRAKEGAGPPALGGPIAHSAPRTAGRGIAPAAALEALHREGLRAYAAGDLARAEARFLKALELDPGDGRARKSLRRIEADRAR